MANGLLTVDGTIDLEQFWPTGSSDADTAKIVVDVGAGAFKFRPHPGAASEETHAFDDATVKGSVRKPAIDKGKLTIRLQGIDAPELHYRPAAALKPADRSQKQDELYKEWNYDYRQPLGETATVNLAEKLRSFGPSPLPCQVTSAVDSPNDVFDTYGRFVGTILIPGGGESFDVNHWLVSAGWSFPAFYASMSAEEIGGLLDAAKVARSAKAGVWKYPGSYARGQDFDWDLRFRKNGAPDPGADIGPVLFPKIFRRLSTWAVNVRSKMVAGSFPAYLRKKPDELFLTNDFLEQGSDAATTRRLDEFIATDGRFTAKPYDLVFREKASKLVGSDGKPVNW